MRSPNHELWHLALVISALLSRVSQALIITNTEFNLIWGIPFDLTWTDAVGPVDIWTNARDHQDTVMIACELKSLDYIHQDEYWSLELFFTKLPLTTECY